MPGAITFKLSGAAVVRDALQRLLDADDSVIVIELKRGSDWSGYRAQLGGTDWLSQNIRAYPVAA